jgi:glycosyltransferase involved in cell wall biosynthesis
LINRPEFRFKSQGFWYSLKIALQFQLISVVSLIILSNPMNTLYVNGRFLTQSLTGVQRFAVEMCKELAPLIPNFHIVVPKGTEPEEETLKPFLYEVGELNGTIWEQVDLYRFMKKKGGLLLNLCNTAPLGYDRNIVTIHDLGVYRNNNWYDWKFAHWYKYLTPRIAKRAKAILTVSEFSKSEIIDVLGVDSQKIHIAYNGVSQDTIGDYQLLTKEKLIVHVGTLSKRKNVKMIVDCYWRSCPNDFKLVLCGNVDKNLALPASEFDMMSGVEVLTGANDSELSALLTRASHIVSASEYEGFGLPILEGLANGAKPILSDIPVYKELFSEVANFFGLDDSDGLTQIFSTLETSENINDEEVVKDHLDRYSFARSAKTINTLIQSL